MNSIKTFCLVIGPRQRASSRLRFHDHEQWLLDNGYDVSSDYVASMDRGFFGIKAKLRVVLRYPLWVLEFSRANIVFMQESMILWPVIWLARCFGLNKKIIFDFSDPVDYTPSKWMRGYRKWMFKGMLERADIVVCENPLYRDLYRDVKPNIRAFYGPVNQLGYQESEKVESHENDAIRIGWTGSPGTLALIEPLFPLIDELGKDFNILLTLVGVDNVAFEFTNVKLECHPWSEPLEYSMVPSFDLGLFALDESEKSERRGAGKLFIYMAAAVPFIATRKGIASCVMDESSVGFAVDTPDKWLEVLRLALQDAKTRDKYSEEGEVFAFNNFTYQRYRSELGSFFAL